MTGKGKGTVDAAPITDEVSAVLTRDTDQPRLPERPATRAVIGDWVEYVVALGMDWDAARVDPETGEERTRTELSELATRLGG